MNSLNEHSNIMYKAIHPEVWEGVWNNVSRVVHSDASNFVHDAVYNPVILLENSTLVAHSSGMYETINNLNDVHG